MTPAQLRLSAGKTGNAPAARRMLALALVLEGVDRETAARSCGMERQTLRDWVHRYNAEGLERYPAKWLHFATRKSRQSNRLEHDP